MARLAVDQSAQGQGLGEALLLDALARRLEISEGLGSFAVEVDAIDESARAFYRKSSFVALQDSDLHLFLPFSTIRAVLGAG